MKWYFFYLMMMLSTTTFLWYLFDSRGTLDEEGKKVAMVSGLLWPLTIIILIIITFNKDNEE